MQYKYQATRRSDIHFSTSCLQQHIYMDKTSIKLRDLPHRLASQAASAASQAASYALGLHPSLVTQEDISRTYQVTLPKPVMDIIASALPFSYARLGRYGIYLHLKYKSVASTMGHHPLQSPYFYKGWKETTEYQDPQKKEEGGLKYFLLYSSISKKLELVLHFQGGILSPYELLIAEDEILRFHGLSGTPVNLPKLILTYTHPHMSLDLKDCQDYFVMYSDHDRSMKTLYEFIIQAYVQIVNRFQMFNTESPYERLSETTLFTSSRHSCLYTCPCNNILCMGVRKISTRNEFCKF